MATVTRAAEGVPPTGGDITSTQLADNFNNIFLFLESTNIDEANVDYTSSDGIMVMSKTQTITGQKTFTAKVLMTGTYDKPLVIGTLRIWDNAGTPMLKAGSDPSSATDGVVIGTGGLT